MPRTGRILVVDDEVNARTALAELLRDEGFDVETAADAFKALGKYEAFAPHVVVTDLKMPGMDGIELVKKLRAEAEPPAVVVMTAFGAVADRGRRDARRRRRLPDQAAQLRRAARRARQGARAPSSCAARRASCARASAIASRRTTSSATRPPMQRVFEIVDQVAPSRATVLITGESGTGKELVANALHQRSPRANGPFVKLHCAALAESLLESELFGHEKGSFTGAMARKDGRFALADGGTLFLDEIGEISPSIQVKLLRFLQEHEFERVGGTQTIQRRRAHDRRDQPQPRRGGREGPVPRGSVLPAQRRRARDAAAARSPRPTSRRSRSSSSTATRKENGKPIDGFAPRDARAADARTTGRATCASSRTRSSARSCSATGTHDRAAPPAAERPARRVHAGGHADRSRARRWPSSSATRSSRRSRRPAARRRRPPRCSASACARSSTGSTSTTRRRARRSRSCARTAATTARKP